MSNPPPLEPLDNKDTPIVASFKQTWSTTPFTTFSYWATSKGQTFPIPGGNCFNFAIAFKSASSATAARLMCHKDHGNVAFKSTTEDRYYTVDSGFNTPVKMPATTTRQRLSFNVIANVPKAINPPDPAVKNVETMYDMKYDSGTQKWGTDHYIKNQTGFKKMEEKTDTEALELAKTNALGQNASVFLSRLVPVGQDPGWGLSVFMYFKKGSGTTVKGDLIIRLPKPNDPANDEVITVNVKTASETELNAAKTKLAQRLVADGLRGQWTEETDKCFDFLIQKLKEA